jgi:hypothetical protein
MSAQTKSWREVIEVHPAADLFPMMSEPELRELGADIKKHGLREPLIIVDDPDGGDALLLDGRNRLAAMELVGMTTTDFTGKFWLLTVLRNNVARERLQLKKFDPYAYVVSMNLHRRHLTAEQKREVIAKLLTAQPEKSDRQIAATAKASPTTVGVVRTELEEAGELSKLDSRQGADGKTRPAHKKPNGSRVDPTIGMEPVPEQAARVVGWFAALNMNAQTELMAAMWPKVKLPWTRDGGRRAQRAGWLRNVYLDMTPEAQTDFLKWAAEPDDELIECELMYPVRAPVEHS